MPIVINIKPEVQKELSRQAAAHGVDVVSYAASLLEEAAYVSAGPKKLSLDSLTRRSKSSRSFLTRFPHSRMKRSRARVCTEITTEVAHDYSDHQTRG